MSAPRPVLPGATYLLTRRCTQRMFLLRPDPLARMIFLYCLAYAARETGIEVHGFVQMSNHAHAVVTDPHARLPEFLQIFHRLTACALNVARGRVENFWAAGSPSVVRLEHPVDVLDKLAYVTANPVAAGLVADPHDWPGMITTQIAQIFEARRPAVFFNQAGNMPEQLTLVCTVPPALQHLERDVVAKRLRRLVRDRVLHEASKFRGEGRTFLGVDGVLAMPTDKIAVTPEVLKKRRPSFAASDRARRLAARDQLRTFRQAHRCSLDEWRAGNRDVRFPHGTYLMRVLHAASCGPPPPPA
jgi:REP element-mobilizing transposase RayT